MPPPNINHVGAAARQQKSKGRRYEIQTHIQQVVELSDAFKSFGSAFVNLDFAAMQAEWNAIREAFTNLLELLGSMVGSVVLTMVILLIVYLVH